MKRTFAATIAASATGALVFGSAIPASAIPRDPVPLYLYAGGTHQSGQPSHTSETEWEAFLGADHEPPAYTVQYPRDLALRPIVDAGYDGGEPGGTRHVGRVTTHDDDVDAKPKKPLRDAVKTIRNEVKKLRDNLRPKDSED